MDRNSAQTGGTGFVIEFPDFIDREPITQSFRRDGQGIHRLEMIAIYEGMDELLNVWDQDPGSLKEVSGVVVCTDRHSITDVDLLNPWRTKEWRKNKWKNHEGKPIKDNDLPDKIDKTRKKLARRLGRTEIVSMPAGKAMWRVSRMSL